MDVGEKVGKDLVCSSCRLFITDQFYFHVGKYLYHSSCLQCSVCGSSLHHHSRCFYHNQKLICCKDYSTVSSSLRCTKCHRSFHRNDWTRRTCEYIYHLTCFTCYQCGRQLSTGEEYGVKKNQILCKEHLIERKEQCKGNRYSGENSFDSEIFILVEQEHKPRRIRTTFTEKQLAYLQNHFDSDDQNPAEQELQVMASLTGLSKRVIQVWFQNSRARQKKMFLDKLKQISKRKNSQY